LRKLGKNYFKKALPPSLFAKHCDVFSCACQMPLGRAQQETE